MSEPAVTRFAPSPTGHLHVGGARTALFNWALARTTGGRFLLRIEDTDRARSSEEAIAGILEDLAWLGIEWDEGPDRGGIGGDPRAVGPFYQSARLASYNAAVASLLERDLAYPAFETAEELDAMRAEARRQKQNFRYRRAADYDPERARERMAREPHVVRFRMPSESIAVEDLVLGEVAFTEEHLDDFVLRKRDGFPTFHLAVVVDDAAMGVTHVLRGQEHLNNTPRHVALQRALCLASPQYLHLPLIFNADGSKMSKRDKDKAARAAVREVLGRDPASLEGFCGVEPARLERWIGDKRAQLETSELDALARALDLELPAIEVEDFRRAGYLPEVLCNFLALLGWAPGVKADDGSDLERFDRAFLAANFAPERIGRANARFDRAKLESFNADTLASLPFEEFLAQWELWCARYAPPELADWDAARRRRLAEALQSRCRTLADATSARGPAAFLWRSDDGYDFDAKAVDRFLRKGDPSGFDHLRRIAPELVALDPFVSDPIESFVASYCEREGVGMGKVAQPLRVAVTGSSASPPLGDTLELLGREAVESRVARCLAECA